MRNIHTNHQRSGRAQGQRRSQDPSPAEFRDDGWPCMLQPCHPQRYVSTDDANGVTAQRVARARRRSRGREEHQKRGGPERGKDERRLEEHRQPAKDADTDEPVHEHEERPYPGQPPRADHVRSDLLLSCGRQQIFECLSLRKDLLELRLWNSKKRGVLVRAKAGVATAGVAR